MEQRIPTNQAYFADVLRFFIGLVVGLVVVLVVGSIAILIALDVGVVGKVLTALATIGGVWALFVAVHKIAMTISQTMIDRLLPE